MSRFLPRSILTSFTCIISLSSFPQDCEPIVTQFSDEKSFSELQLMGDTTHFELLDGSLHLTQDDSGNSKLWFPSNFIYDTSWEFSLRMDFNPSSSNLATIQLAGDSLGQEAYYLKIGGTKDQISLNRTKNGANSVMIAGPENRLDLPTVDLEILVQVDEIGNWLLKSKVGTEAEYFIEGEAIDQSIIDSDYFIVDFKYTSTRADKFWINYFEICGSAFPDLIPPVLESFEVSSPNKVELDFSDSLDISEATFEVTYPFLNVNTTVNQISPHKVLLEFEQEWRNGLVYSLDIQNITDLSGNRLDTLIEFLYFIQQPVAAQDVVINELMIDPSPQEDLPEYEFIEIYNKSENPIQLKDWIVKDKSAEAHLPEKILQVEEHLILIPSSAQADYSTHNYLTVAPWPTLNNTNNTVSIYDAKGILIDSLHYDMANHDGLKKEGGWSLERIDPENPCILNSNWNYSESPLGGTPGDINSIRQFLNDSVGPELDIVANIGDSIVSLGFTESITISDSTLFKFDHKVRPWSFEEQSNQKKVNLLISESLLEINEPYLTVENLSDCYGNHRSNISQHTAFDLAAPSIDTAFLVYHDQIIIEFSEAISSIEIELEPDLENYIISENGRSMVIELTNPILDVINMDIVILNITDSLGNHTSHQTQVFELTPPPIAQRGDLLITEILVDPLPIIGLPDIEFIELQNLTDKPIFLRGMELSDASSSGKVMEGILDPFEIGLLVKNSESFQLPDTKTFSVKSWPTLNDASDSILIRSQRGDVIDELSYSQDWHSTPEKANGGWSLEMIDLDYPCRGERNWTSSQDPKGGTPGYTNSVATTLIDQTGPLIEKAIVNGSDTVTLFFNETIHPESVSLTSFTFNHGIEINRFVIDPGLDKIDLILTQPLERGHRYELALTDISDCSGNVVNLNNSVELIFPEQVGRNNLIITEILFDPLPGGFDFVEVYNPTNLFLNLKGSFMISLSDTVQIHQDIFVPPLNYFALTEGRVETAAAYSVSQVENIVEIKLPLLPNKNGKFRLESVKRDLIDEMRYDESMHLDLFNDTEGISLEKISLVHPSSETSNWASASSLIMATPGHPNSQKRELIEQVDIIEVSPRVFDPHSTIENFATIQYSLNSPGLIGTIEVYNSSGIRTAKLLDTEYLPQTGFVVWDGRLQNGSLAKPDIYIVYAEFFSLNGEVVKSKETVAIASRF